MTELHYPWLLHTKLLKFSDPQIRGKQVAKSNELGVKIN